MTAKNDKPKTTPVLEVGHVRYERGEGKVRLKWGAFVRDVQPSTARAYAIALIHSAEIAGLPPEPAGLRDEDGDPLGR